VPARGAQRGIGQATPTRTSTWQAFLPQHPGHVQTFNNDAAVSFSQSRGQDVQMMRTDIIDPAMQPGHLSGALTILP
jgi:hypothetical protein